MRPRFYSSTSIVAPIKFAVAATLLCVVGNCAPSPAAPAVEAPSLTTGQQTTYPSFEAMLADLENSILAKYEHGIAVPVPVDAGGGYTHEQHKQNGKTIYEAGMLYAQTGNAVMRDVARDVLLDYAELYPSLDLHPRSRENHPAGRLFWQGLNEAVWLVYAIQGYEAIRADLTDQDRQNIEDGVINPMADFLSKGSPRTFNRIHNHGTWSAAAVGMTGYVLDDQVRVEQALLGLDSSGEAGFLKQLEQLFSPDGYYAEGPYYQRYALMPFVLFAQAIEQNEPERKIFEYRDGVLLKAIRSTVQQSYAGRFFPINDAIREKGLNTVELKYGLAIAYAVTGDRSLLGAAALQNGTVPTTEGRKLSDALQAGDVPDFPFETMALSDGPDGESGALVILRSGQGAEDAAVVMKATSQGLGHGHFDKLGLLYYDNGDEVVADYGAARFLNVEPKNGGRYLPENTSWAKQSVAHNTLVVDETSHFDGDWRYGQQFSPRVLAFQQDEGIQVASAEIDTAYEGVTFRRTVAMVPKAGSESPYIIDIVQAQSSAEHQYDLPVHFKGQLIQAGFDLSHSTTELRPLGSKNGYQHLWKRAQSELFEETSSLSWLLDDQFYTLTVSASAPTEAILAELGANDPNHNLRREQALILRADSHQIDFVSVFERHGRYDNDEEITVFNGSSIDQIEQIKTNDLTNFRIHTKAGDVLSVLLADSPDPSTEHTHVIDGESLRWNGVVHVHHKSEKPNKEGGRDE